MNAPCRYVDSIPRLPPVDLLVVACTPHYFRSDYVSDFRIPAEWGAEVRCRFTSDLSLVEQADALWFHGPSITRLPHKRDGQKWILMCMESEANYPFLGTERVMELFDVHMTYRLDSDVPCVYPNREHYRSFSDPPLPLAHKHAGRSPILYIASNPVRDRDDYVRELMAHVPVDSPGRCLNNLRSERLAGRFRARRMESVQEVIRHYCFYLAFENSRADGRNAATLPAPR